MRDGAGILIRVRSALHRTELDVERSAQEEESIGVGGVPVRYECSQVVHKLLIYDDYRLVVVGELCGVCE
jgi:hypothetical protein